MGSDESALQVVLESADSVQPVDKLDARCMDTPATSLESSIADLADAEKGASKFLVRLLHACHEGCLGFVGVLEES